MTNIPKVGFQPPESWNNFWTKFREEGDAPSVSGHGLTRAVHAFNLPQKLAWISLVASQIGDPRTQKNYLPIDPLTHTVQVGDQDNKQTYGYDDKPFLVLSDCRDACQQRLKASLQAEAWSRELVVLMNERETRSLEEEHMLSVAQRFADYFTVFHRTRWNIIEPAAVDTQGRWMQAQAVCKRMIRPVGTRAA